MSGNPMTVTDAYVQSMRATRARQLAQAAADYRKAVDDLEYARRAERIASAAKSNAYKKLQELMEGDTNKVIGDILLTVNATGGVDIRKVDVLPLTGVQTCLL
jgi:hypothetical protein